MVCWFPRMHIFSKFINEHDELCDELCLTGSASLQMEGSFPVTDQLQDGESSFYPKVLSML